MADASSIPSRRSSPNSFDPGSFSNTRYRTPRKQSRRERRASRKSAFVESGSDHQPASSSESSDDDDCIVLDEHLNANIVNDNVAAKTETIKPKCNASSEVNDVKKENTSSGSDQTEPDVKLSSSDGSTQNRDTKSNNLAEDTTGGASSTVTDNVADEPVNPKQEAKKAECDSTDVHETFDVDNAEDLSDEVYESLEKRAILLESKAKILEAQARKINDAANTITDEARNFRGHVFELREEMSTKLKQKKSSASSRTGGGAPDIRFRFKENVNKRKATDEPEGSGSDTKKRNTHISSDDIFAKYYTKPMPSFTSSASSSGRSSPFASVPKPKTAPKPHPSSKPNPPDADGRSNPRESAALNRDRLFEESLFDALADKEAAEYWQRVYGQPIHVYADPSPPGQSMTPSAYASYVKAKMFEKTAQGIAEEKVRRQREQEKADEAARQHMKAQEEARKAEWAKRQENLRRAAEARARRQEAQEKEYFRKFTEEKAREKEYYKQFEEEKARESSHSNWHNYGHFDSYGSYWGGSPEWFKFDSSSHPEDWNRQRPHSQPSGYGAGAQGKTEFPRQNPAPPSALDWKSAHMRYTHQWLAFLSKPNADASAIPWPTYTGLSKDVNEHQVTTFLRNTAAFWASSSRTNTDRLASILKVERVRWHPDKMAQRLGGVTAKIEPATMKSVTVVFQVIDNLWQKTKGQ